MFSFETDSVAEAASVLCAGVICLARGWIGHPFATSKCLHHLLQGLQTGVAAFHLPQEHLFLLLLIPGRAGGKCCPSVPQRWLFPSERSEHHSQITVLYGSPGVYGLTEHHAETGQGGSHSALLVKPVIHVHRAENQPGKDNPGLEIHTEVLLMHTNIRKERLNGSTSSHKPAHTNLGVF